MLFLTLKGTKCNLIFITITHCLGVKDARPKDFPDLVGEDICSDTSEFVLLDEYLPPPTKQSQPVGFSPFGSSTTPFMCLLPLLKDSEKIGKLWENMVYKIGGFLKVKSKKTNQFFLQFCYNLFKPIIFFNLFNLIYLQLLIIGEVNF